MKESYLFKCFCFVSNFSRNSFTLKRDWRENDSCIDRWYVDILISTDETNRLIIQNHINIDRLQLNTYTKKFNRN